MNRDFLKTILPLSDELNDILGMVFTRNPEQRITLRELRNQILACPHLTKTAPTTGLETPPTSPGATTEYVECEDAIDDTPDYEYVSPLSPASSMSDEDSDCSSDDGSLTSNGSTIDDLDEEFMQEQQQPQQQQPEAVMSCPSPPIYEPEEPRFAPQEYVPQHYTGPVPGQFPMTGQLPLQMVVTVPVSVPVPAPTPCAPKSLYNAFWDLTKYMQQGPALHPHVPFHQQVPLFALQGCC